MDFKVSTTFKNFVQVRQVCDLSKGVVFRADFERAQFPLESRVEDVFEDSYNKEQNPLESAHAKKFFPKSMLDQNSFPYKFGGIRIPSPLEISFLSCYISVVPPITFLRPKITPHIFVNCLLLCLMAGSYFTRM